VIPVEARAEFRDEGGVEGQLRCIRLEVRHLIKLTKDKPGHVENFEMKEELKGARLEVQLLISDDRTGDKLGHMD
jgi:hypothetical protein